MKSDARIDAYITEAAQFARPILSHLRALVHRTLPDAEETIKWGMPHFTLDGKNVCGMAAFKKHCAFTIHGEGRGGSEGMGQHGKLTSLDEMPADAVLEQKVRKAAERIAEQGTAVVKRTKSKAEIAIPDDFANALTDNARASATFESFPPGARREYLEWITDAKRAETRAARIVQAVDWLAEGKKRNWKYEKC